MSRLQPAFIAKQKQSIKKPVTRLGRRKISQECEIMVSIPTERNGPTWNIFLLKSHLKFTLKK